MDTSSESGGAASLLKMTSGMSQKEREDFNDAIYGIIKFAKDEMSKPNGRDDAGRGERYARRQNRKGDNELHKTWQQQKASSALHR